MSDIDRYITDEAAQAGWPSVDTDDTRSILEAALPGILAQHRADVLRGAAARLDLIVSEVKGTDGSPEATMLRLWADEAVAG